MKRENIERGKIIRRKKRERDKEMKRGDEKSKK